MSTNWRFRRYWIVIILAFHPAVAQMTVQGGQLEQDTSASSTSDPAHPSQLNLEFDMTSQEAAHLLASVDEVLAFDSKVTGLRLRSPVPGKMTSRNELRELTKKKLQDSDATQSIQRSATVLMKFGFIPRDFHVRQFADEITVNEVARYYDPRVKTMYLLNWLPADTQLPIMAHELDHALQDQNFQLESWFSKDDPEANDATGGDSSEQKAARRAVAEGHATAVMMEYLLSKQGRSLAEMPVIPPEELQAIIDHFVTIQTTQAVPLLLREQMAFPYTYGLRFVHQMLVKAGREQAYSAIFKRPPQNTRQILEPATYLAHEQLPPLPLPALERALGPEYEKVGSGSMGEFDCMILMKQFKSATANELPSKWRGDFFYAATRLRLPPAENGRGAVEEKNLKPEDVALIFVSRWVDATAARDFAAFYGDTVMQRYSQAEPATRSASSGSVNIRSWSTPGGRVAVEVHGNLVIALESIDDLTASRVVTAVLETDKP